MLFIVLWYFSRGVRPRGAVSGVFLIGYGSLRFVAEFFRMPDDGIFGLSEVISMGQWLSLPMILIGVVMPVSYTHLDVYKRQVLHRESDAGFLCRCQQMQNGVG